MSAIPLLPFLHDCIAIVDLETTGTAAASDGITEIGIIRVLNGEVIGKWHSSPEVPLRAVQLLRRWVEEGLVFLRHASA